MSRLGHGILGRREKMIQQHFIIISLEGTFFPLQQLLCLEVHNRKYKRTKNCVFQNVCVGIEENCLLPLALDVPNTFKFLHICRHRIQQFLKRNSFNAAKIQSQVF